MNKTALLFSILFCISLYATTGLTEDRQRQQMQQHQVYGWQLMTEQEREQHRNMMRSFKTEQEREVYRKEHHQKMQARAKEQGVTLPEEPRQRGGGMGMGGGSGGGKGR